MSDAAIPQAERFKLSMLIYDSRYRSATIQAVVLTLVLAFVFWIVNNAVTNLAALGKPIRFDFLGDTASYDINQKLIEYSSTDSHGRAVLVGLLNTLLVAFMGCVTATVIGVIGGVLRLSNNWLVSRLMVLYVEIFRNVPLLLWIFVCMFTLTALAPQPRAFRGENPEATMKLWDSIAITNRGIYLPEPLFSRSLGNIDIGIFLISVDLLAILAVLGAGIFAARWNSKRANAIQTATGDRPKTLGVNTALIVVPVLALLVILGFHIGKPALAGFNFRGGINMSAPLIALWLGLSLYTGTYIVEAVRSGIQAVNKGQTEAASALGIRPGRTMSLVVLPQAMRIIIPQLISQYLNLTKNSSLAIAIGYMDLVSTLGGVTLNQTGREMECILLLMAIYLTISLLISGGMNWYNERVKLVER
ncbi:amino acid ABC transporter permease [Poseidonocella sedimentorum]|uniref:L-glutamine ABC transporter membrane protein /L-glutamate ABC transporter membrane protein /L-aspartate ABC transporter membrane protein /L-asparagine ABC transporter membrane protein n=1 Tax=Poseidonocella sedimentorum TaxID=871652 RepID=A0A1I6DMU6_9RHOB|nr:ABC transporter permease subunit [Poseidonocella sedimentorum]SFR06687.1 L-glutamine ABC transporter membrane protein /L-glutamate ABC transporter membrane protein /L-aspartate ABC transporter membrane protein /L-asparagine ABC transporter membrane protein [Poseidonocella sedimentorum]